MRVICLTSSPRVIFAGSKRPDPPRATGPGRPAERIGACASPLWPVESAAPGSSAACSTTSDRPTPVAGFRSGADLTVIGNTGDDITPLRAPGLSRHRHPALHPRWRHPRGPGLGSGRRVAPPRRGARRARRRAPVVHARRQGLRHPRLPLAAARAGYAAERRHRPALRPLGARRPRCPPPADDRHSRRDPRGRRAGRRAARDPLPGVVGAAPGRAPRRAVRRGGPRPGDPAPGCSTRSARPTSSSCRRATPSSRSASSSACPGVRDALRGTRAPVVGVSPLVGGRPVRGHADVCLRTIGVDETSAAVAGLYADFLDGWLVDEEDPMPGGGPGSRCVRRPLLMSSVDGGGRDGRRRAGPRSASCGRSEHRRDGAHHDHAADRHTRGPRGRRPGRRGRRSGSTTPGCVWPTATSSSSRARSRARPSASSRTTPTRTASCAVRPSTSWPSARWEPGSRASCAPRPARSWRRPAWTDPTRESAAGGCSSPTTPTGSASSSTTPSWPGTASGWVSCSATPQAAPGGWVRSTSRWGRTVCASSTTCAGAPTPTASRSR